MITALFDIETNGLLDKLDTLHCLVIKIYETGEVYSCHDNHTDDQRWSYLPTPDKLTKYNRCSNAVGMEVLQKADRIVGHNIIGFDIPALKKIYPEITLKGEVFDTLIASRLMWPDMKEKDWARRDTLKRKYGEVKMNEMWPGKIIGSHALGSWGYRLGCWKGEYTDIKGQKYKDIILAEHMRHRDMGKLVKDCPPKAPKRQEVMDYVWGTWDREMQDYCDQDVEVTEKLYARILARNYSQEALNLEHEFAHIIRQQEEEGFCFNVEKAQELECILMQRMAEISATLQSAFPPWEVRSTFIPKSNNKARGYVKGVPFEKVKTMVFNPGSRDHIADRLMVKYGWKPEEYTDNGKPKIDETVMKAMDFPESELLQESLMISKRLGMLSEGKNAWLNMVHPDGRMRGRMVTNGAVTGRCTHSSPNVAQTPAAGSPYGKECRSLYGPPKGMKQVGADLSGIELRCLAHFMSRWDGGAYIKELLEGDIHTANQLAAGLPTRDNAKTFIYGFLYGAGGAKIGEIVNGDAKVGKKLIDQFLNATPAIKEIRKAVARKCDRFLFVKEGYRKSDGSTGYRSKKVANDNYVGHLVGLDGRLLPIRSSHSAVNTLLQSAGAVIAKKAGVILHHLMTEKGYVLGTDWGQMAMVHDEYQCWAKPELAKIVGETCIHAFEQAGDYFNFRCPITGEDKIGDNWYDTH